MSERVITIKKVGTVNNVMYRDVLVGSFEDGDTETLAMIIDRAIDVSIERRAPSLKDAFERTIDLAYDMGRKGQNINTAKQLILLAC
jgi:hypothetical protein